MSDSGDDYSYCPLCMEEMDLDDRSFFPCPCDYQICRFCYHRIIETFNGKCPACRRPYEEKNIRWHAISAEEIAKLKAEKKAKDREKKELETGNKKHLANVRVIQRNLAYVVGLPPHLATEEILKGPDYFGQFGKINKIVINKKQITSRTGEPIISVGAYVTFASKEDTAVAIQTVDGSTLENRLLRATYGTTKYCSYYLRGIVCQNPNCMYLHEPGEEADYGNRDENSKSGFRPLDSAASAKPYLPRSHTTNPHSLIAQPTSTKLQIVPSIANIVPNRDPSSVSVPSRPSSTAPASKTFASIISENAPKTPTTPRTVSVNSEKPSTSLSTSAAGSALPATASWGSRVTSKTDIAEQKKLSDSVFENDGPHFNPIDSSKTIPTPDTTTSLNILHDTDSNTRTRRVTTDSIQKPHNISRQMSKQPWNNSLHPMLQQLSRERKEQLKRSNTKAELNGKSSDSDSASDSSSDKSTEDYPNVERFEKKSKSQRGVFENDTKSSDPKDDHISLPADNKPIENQLENEIPHKIKSKLDTEKNDVAIENEARTNNSSTSAFSKSHLGYHATDTANILENDSSTAPLVSENINVLSIGSGVKTNNSESGIQTNNQRAEQDLKIDDKDNHINLSPRNSVDTLKNQLSNQHPLKDTSLNKITTQASENVHSNDNPKQIPVLKDNFIKSLFGNTQNPSGWLGGEQVLSLNNTEVSKNPLKQPQNTSFLFGDNILNNPGSMGLYARESNILTPSRLDSTMWSNQLSRDSISQILDPDPNPLNYYAPTVNNQSNNRSLDEGPLPSSYLTSPKMSQNQRLYGNINSFGGNSLLANNNGGNFGSLGDNLRPWAANNNENNLLHYQNAFDPQYPGDSSLLGVGLNKSLRERSRFGFAQSVLDGESDQNQFSNNYKSLLSNSTLFSSTENNLRNISSNQSTHISPLFELEKGGGSIPVHKSDFRSVGPSENSAFHVHETPGKYSIFSNQQHGVYSPGNGTPVLGLGDKLSNDKNKLNISANIKSPGQGYINTPLGGYQPYPMASSSVSNIPENLNVKPDMISLGLNRMARNNQNDNTYPEDLWGSNEAKKGDAHITPIPSQQDIYGSYISPSTENSINLESASHQYHNLSRNQFQPDGMHFQNKLHLNGQTIGAPLLSSLSSKKVGNDQLEKNLNQQFSLGGNNSSSVPFQDPAILQAQLSKGALGQSTGTPSHQHLASLLARLNVGTPETSTPSNISSSQATFTEPGSLDQNTQATRYISDPAIMNLGRLQVSSQAKLQNQNALLQQHQNLSQNNSFGDIYSKNIKSKPFDSFFEFDAAAIAGTVQPDQLASNLNTACSVPNTDITNFDAKNIGELEQPSSILYNTISPTVSQLQSSQLLGNSFIPPIQSKTIPQVREMKNVENLDGQPISSDFYPRDRLLSEKAKNLPDNRDVELPHKNLNQVQRSAESIQTDLSHSDHLQHSIRNTKNKPDIGVNNNSTLQSGDDYLNLKVNSLIPERFSRGPELGVRYNRDPGINGINNNTTDVRIKADSNFTGKSLSPNNTEKDKIHPLISGNIFSVNQGALSERDMSLYPNLTQQILSPEFSSVLMPTISMYLLRTAEHATSIREFGERVSNGYEEAKAFENKMNDFIEAYFPQEQENFKYSNKSDLTESSFS
ncbi:hypothetical protein BB558_004271 [Smittium angustum]|uniref:RING-type domain-containing protein n=1 Tax=Smittium angustum TaxID=133377 RepID=A0A2U1J3S0_SMIAN|nr:hypothetical protein BB558_004271 [Smittium angustum]